MKKLLIVVDYQNDFVDGALGFEGAEKYEAIICEKIRKYREEGADVMFTYDMHHDDYMETEEGKNLPVPHCIDGTEGMELYGEVRELKEDYDMVFRKPAFGSIEMGKYLEHKNYEYVEMCGLVSNICVLSNAVIAKASIPNAHIVVDAKATGSMSAEMDEKTFDILEGIHVEVLNR